MAETRLKIAVDMNDRTLPLAAGIVGFDGFEADFETAPLETIFARAFDEAPYDVTELSASNYLYLTATEGCPYIGLPVFPSRSFRHSAIYIRTDRDIASPRDLIGRTVGVREYSMTAALVARGMLEDEYGVRSQDVRWLYGRADGKDSQPIARMQPAGVSLEPISPDETLSDMLADGRIDAMVAYKPPPAFLEGVPNVARLFVDYPALERDYARRTGIFPIMHLIGIRRDLAQSRPELIPAICDGFERARRYSLDKLSQAQALSTMLPWGVAELDKTQAILGADHWRYGVADNRAALAALCRYSHAQGIAPREIDIAELFAPKALDWQP
jgi:4,5-dihydroxyphthalate decarboxylase